MRRRTRPQPTAHRPSVEPVLHLHEQPVAITEPGIDRSDRGSREPDHDPRSWLKERPRQGASRRAARGASASSTWRSSSGSCASGGAPAGGKALVRASPATLSLLPKSRPAGGPDHGDDRRTARSLETTRVTSYAASSTPGPASDTGLAPKWPARRPTARCCGGDALRGGLRALEGRVRAVVDVVDYRLELLRGQRSRVVRGHHVRVVAGDDLLVGIDDRLAGGGGRI